MRIEVSGGSIWPLYDNQRLRALSDSEVAEIAEAIGYPSAEAFAKDYDGSTLTLGEDLRPLNPLLTVTFANGGKLFCPTADPQEARTMAEETLRSITGLPLERCTKIASIEPFKREDLDTPLPII